MVGFTRNPPGFALIELADPRDAEEAVRHLDGKLVKPSVSVLYYCIDKVTRPSWSGGDADSFLGTFALRKGYSSSPRNLQCLDQSRSRRKELFVPN